MAVSSSVCDLEVSVPERGDDVSILEGRRVDTKDARVFTKMGAGPERLGKEIQACRFGLLQVIS